MFSYKYTSFDNWDKAIIKFNRISIFWKKAKEFYEEKKRVVNNFSDELDLNKYLSFFDNIGVDIAALKSQKLEEAFLKVIKFVEDDILNLKDFLKIALSIFDDVEKVLFNENTKKTDEIKGRNIDPAIKMLIQKVYSDAYNQFI